jgi:hypothetical protein
MPFFHLRTSWAWTGTILLIIDSTELGRKFIKKLNYAYLGLLGYDNTQSGKHTLPDR